MSQDNNLHNASDNNNIMGIPGTINQPYINSDTNLNSIRKKNFSNYYFYYYFR